MERNEVTNARRLIFEFSNDLIKWYDSKDVFQYLYPNRSKLGVVKNK